MSITFKFAIGDRVAGTLAIDELVRSFDYHDYLLRPHVLTVEERISVECVVGTQLFYTCRDIRGAIEKHPEAMLAPAKLMWDAWIDGIERQRQRLAEQKK